MDLKILSIFPPFYITMHWCPFCQYYLFLLRNTLEITVSRKHCVSLAVFVCESWRRVAVVMQFHEFPSLGFDRFKLIADILKFTLSVMRQKLTFWRITLRVNSKISVIKIFTWISNVSHL